MLRKICLFGALIVVAVSFGASSASAARCPKGHHHPSGSSFFGDGFSDGRASVGPGSDGFSDGRA
jgi:hypothetical protein